MSSTRFIRDPNRVFPDHAYAPGYEPVAREPVPEDAPERIIGRADFARFAAAACLLAGMLAVVSVLLMPNP